MNEGLGELRVSQTLFYTIENIFNIPLYKSSYS